MTDNELNELIAEKVMGWIRIDEHLVMDNENFIAQWEDRGRPYWVPDYCNDIAAALYVAEKQLITILPVRNSDNSVTWWAAQMIGGNPGTWIPAPTASRAICLAALAAVGVFAVAVDATGDLYGGGG